MRRTHPPRGGNSFRSSDFSLRTIDRAIAAWLGFHTPCKALGIE
jgi:hypothetical protein